MKKNLFFMMMVSFSVNAMTLDDSIRLALDNSVQLKKTDLDSRMTSLKIAEKESLGLGIIRLEGSYDHYNLPRTLGTITPSTMSYDTPSTKDLYTAGIRYSVPLFTGYALTNDVKVSELERQKHFITGKLSRQQIIYNVKNVYLSILALQERKSSMETYRSAQAALVRQVEKEVELGRKAYIDLLKGKSDLIGIGAQVDTIAKNIDILEATLEYLTGSKADRLEPIDIAVVEPRFTGENVEGLERLRLLDLSMMTIERKIAIQESRSYPQVAFRSYYGQNMGFNDSENPNSGDFNNQEIWSAGITVQYDLFDFGARSSSVESTRIEKLKTSLERDDLVREIRLELKSAMAKTHQAMAGYESAKASFELLEKSTEIEQVRYENGAIDINDLLLIRAQKEMTKANLIESKYDYQRSIHYIEYLLEEGTDS